MHHYFEMNINTIQICVYLFIYCSIHKKKDKFRLDAPKEKEEDHLLLETVSNIFHKNGVNLRAIELVRRQVAENERKLKELLSCVMIARSFKCIFRKVLLKHTHLSPSFIFHTMLKLLLYGKTDTEKQFQNSFFQYLKVFIWFVFSFLFFVYVCMCMSPKKHTNNFK